MMQFKRFAAAPALMLLMSGTAHAALTADQVWESWKAGAEQVGLSLTAGSENRNGADLELKDVTVSVKDGDAAEGLKISTISLVEEGGAVRVRPGDITLKSDSEGEVIDAALKHDALEILASEGTNGGVVYDYSATRVDLNVAYTGEGMSFEEGVTAEPVTSSGVFNVEGLKGSYSDTPGTNRAFGVDMTIDKLLYNLVSSDPNMGMESKSNTETADITAKLAVTLPHTILMAQAVESAEGFKTALLEGLGVSLETNQGVSTGSSTETSEFMPYDLTMASEPGKMSARFDKDGISLLSSGDGLKILANSPMLAAPAEVTMGPMQFDMVSPVIADAPAPYGMVLKFSQLSLSDSLWDMVDGAKALKREPLDLVLDLSGEIKMDLTTIASAEEEAAMGAMPQPQSLNINEVLVKAAGAALEAKGAFTFDHSMGMPAPLGEANVLLTGADQLMDALVANGLLSEDDLMGARMMMAAFMEAGPTEGSLQSKIEAKEGFQIFVNGQQIQ